MNANFENSSSHFSPTIRLTKTQAIFGVHQLKAPHPLGLFSLSNFVQSSGLEEIIASALAQNWKHSAINPHELLLTKETSSTSK